MALSKFLMGSVSDRSNPRYFLPLGLLLSASIIAACGLEKGIYASLTTLIVLQTVNGWVQGMGWPACGKTMVHWFSTNERGTVVSVWNTAHNVGGGLVANLAGLGVLLFGDWGAKFYFNAAIAAGLAILAFLLMRDTPQSCGLPPIERHRDDYPPGYSDAHERNFTFRQIFMEHVLNNKYLWAIAVANAFVYFVRYGVVNWIPTYLETHKHFSFQQSAIGYSLYEYAAIPGTIICGWVSDKVFKSRRAPATILFMALTLVAVVVYWLNINGPLWIDYVALIVDRVPDLRADHAHRPPRAGPRAEEGRRNRRRVHRVLRLRVRVSHRRHRRRLDRRSLGLERCVHHDGGVLRADDGVQRDDPGPHGHQPQAHAVAPSLGSDPGLTPTLQHSQLS